MAIKEVIDGAPNQTLGGQPVQSARDTDGGIDDSNISTEVQPNDVAANSEDGTTGGTSTEDAQNGTQSKTADIQISPEALRQITALSSQNRQLRSKFKELEAKIAAQAQPEDVTKQLAKLKELEAVLKSPRAYLQASGKTLEDVAADVLAAGNEVQDPRVDAVTELVSGINKRLDAQAEAEKKRYEETQTQAQKQNEIGVITHAKTIAASNVERWENIANDAKAVEAAAKATILIVRRDYAEQKNEKGEVTRAAKPLTKEAADALLDKCLDEAEAMALAQKIVAARKNGGQREEPRAVSRGIQLREEPGEQANPLPKPSAGTERGPTRTMVKVQRGQTDVRTARARAMKVAGAD